MNVLDTITHPWREPVDYAKLVLAVVVFAVVAFAMYDMLRILTLWMKNAATN